LLKWQETDFRHVRGEQHCRLDVVRRQVEIRHGGFRRIPFCEAGEDAFPLPSSWRNQLDPDLDHLALRHPEIFIQLEGLAVHFAVGRPGHAEFADSSSSIFSRRIFFCFSLFMLPQRAQMR
jgi:hypothetical protein